MKISEILQMIPTRFSFESNSIAILMLLAYLTSHCLLFAEGQGREKERNAATTNFSKEQRERENEGRQGGGKEEWRTKRMVGKRV
jgi:hypothetical protein